MSTTSRVSQALAHIQSDIADKRVLEVACGCAEFSICASAYAANVVCIDLDSSRLSPAVQKCENVLFRLMDATSLTYDQDSFDSVVMYNAVGHVDHVLDAVLSECLRVVRPGGRIWIISSFKMDHYVIESSLIPILRQRQIPYQIDSDRVFIYVRI